MSLNMGNFQVLILYCTIIVDILFIQYYANYFYNYNIFIIIIMGFIIVIIIMAIISPF